MRLITLFIFILLLAACRQEKTHKLESMVRLDSYPSASGIEYLNKLIYIIGDDARNILVVDTQFQVKDSILLFNTESNRIPKNTKPDIEGLTALRSENRNYLLGIGSGSLSPHRNVAMLIDPFRQAIDSFRLDSLYFRFKEAGIKDLNIEGICFMYGTIAMVSRGNKSFPRNLLILTANEFWKKQTSVVLNTIRIGVNNDTSVFNGISGLAYSQKSDQLIMSVSTEDTYSSYQDGTIGKSYIWIVKNISSKREWSAINPDVIVDLEEIDPRFKGQKIESVCIMNEQKKEMQLALCADNDDGSSTVFKINLIKD
jgi:hypothetical protein